MYQKRCDQKRQGQADWWGSFDVELNTEQHEVRLVCLRCTAKLGASNPSRAAKDHLKSRACIKAAAVSAAAVAAVQAAADVAAGGDAAEEEVQVVSGSKRHRGGVGITPFMATAGQVTQARNSLARFFYKSGVAFHLIEQEDLVAAFAAVGIDLPSRRALAGRMLDTEYARVSSDVWAAIDSLHLVQIASDGCRRKHCGDGTPMVNLMAIHQLESDKALLSQMLPIWKQLLKHAEDFDKHSDNDSRSAVLPLFERRYEMHRDKSWPAAFVVDPIHAFKADGEWFLLSASSARWRLRLPRSASQCWQGRAMQRLSETSSLKCSLHHCQRQCVMRYPR